MRFLHPWIKSWTKMAGYFRGYYSIRRMVDERIQERGLTYENSSRKITIAASYINFVNAILADIGGVDISVFARSDLAKIWTDFYSIILLLDDRIDLAEDTSGEKKRQGLQSFFSTLYRAMDDLETYKASLDRKDKGENHIFCFIDSWEHYWKAEYKDIFAPVVSSMEQEWILEGLPGNSAHALRSLEAVPKASVDILAASVEVFYSTVVPAVSREPVYAICFAGNILDDFVDYFVTREDRGKTCYIELRNSELHPRLLGLESWRALVELYAHAIWALFKAYLKSINNLSSGWVIPMAVRFMYFVGPLNLWTAYCNRDNIRNTILEAEPEPKIGALTD